MKKILCVLLCIVLGVCCAMAEPLVITDMMGVVSELQGPAERVVVLTAGECEILYALGAGDTVVGRGEYCDWPEEVLTVPSVQSGFETNIEQIIALEPQALISSTMNQTKEQMEALANAGIAAVQSATGDLESVYTDIRMVGQTVGRETEAEELIASMRERLAAVTAEIPSGRTVYIEVSPLEWGLWASGSGTFLDEIAAMVGLTNIFVDMPAWAEISEEQVLERDPDYIITVTGLGAEEIGARAGWQGLKAVMNGNVIALDPNATSRPGPRLADAAEQLSAAVNGK